MRIVRWIAIVVGLLLVALLSVPFLLNANQFRPLLESNLTAALGRDVKLGDLQLAILSGGVSASDLSIADDPSFSQTPFLRAKSLKIALELMPLLFSHKLNVTGLTIDQPEISLLQTASGNWNLSSLGAKSAAKPQPADAAPGGKSSLDLSVKLVKIASGRLSLGTVKSSAKPRVLSKMDVELRDFSAASVFPYSFSADVEGGGAIKLEGKAGPIDSTDTALTPVQVNLKVTKLNVADSSGIAGLVSLDGSGESNGKSLQLKGRLKAEQLKLAKNGSPASRPLEFDFAIDHDLRKRSGVLSRGDIHVGAAPASLTGSYSRRGESTVLNMNLSGPSMAVQELTAMLPALGVALPAGSSLQGGTASAKLALEGPVDKLVTSGFLSLNDTRLAGFDLGSKLSAVAKLAGMQAGPDTQIQIFSANVRVDPAGTRADTIKLIAPSIGELNGDGTVGADQSLDFKMHATLHTTGALASIGQTSVPFTVAGTTTNPLFRPDMKGMASEQVKGLARKEAGGVLNRLFGRKPK